jgi:hypothetical protein
MKAYQARRARSSNGERTPQTKRDQKKIDQMRQQNGKKYDEAATRLARWSKPQLLLFAKEISESREEFSLDRLCLRSRTWLICWFCKNSPDFPAGFRELEDQSRPLSETSIVPALIEPPQEDVEQDSFDMEMESFGPTGCDFDSEIFDWPSDQS